MFSAGLLGRGESCLFVIIENEIVILISSFCVAKLHTWIVEEKSAKSVADIGAAHVNLEQIVDLSA